MSGCWGQYPLGRLAKKPEAKHLMLAKYLQLGHLPVPPEHWDGYLGGRAAPRMYANNVYGDCTIAGIANHTRIQAAVDRRALPEYTDQEITDYYFKLSGGADSGLVETDVLDHVIANGFPIDGRYKFVARATIDHTNWQEMKLAAYLFGGVYLGILLPKRIQAMGSHWSVQGDGATGADEPGSWGGHCVVMSGFDNTPSPADAAGNPVGNVSLATWGSVVYATKHWMNVYCEEAHVLLDESHLNMPGIDGDALRADIAALGAGG